MFCVSFLFQSLGMAYQDAHSNTFVSNLKNVPHRWLSFIHACYALGTFVGPLIATATANSPNSLAINGWKRVYFVLIGVSLLNVAGVMVAFRDTLYNRLHTEKQSRGNRMVMLAMAQLLKSKKLWLLSLFYFFELGATLVSIKPPALVVNLDLRTNIYYLLKLIRVTVCELSILNRAVGTCVFLESIQKGTGLTFLYGSTAGGWVVEFLTTVRGGKLSNVGYIPTGFYGGLLAGRLLLPEPTFRFGERRMILIYSIACAALQLVFWLQPSIIGSAIALSFIGFFSGPFFATVSSHRPKSYVPFTISVL